MASISINDFKFEMSGYGCYKVTYTSPKTKKSWTKSIHYMPFIDATMNAETPKIKDLNTLKRAVKYERSY